VSALAWILVGGLLMSAIALTGSLTLLMPPATLQRLLAPFVSLAAGTLLGGAFFHLMPAGSAIDDLAAAAWILGGFTTFLILTGDALHNFLGGLGIGSTFLVNAHAGISAWLAAAAHEVPQELGDFGVLLHGGWQRRSALIWNFASGLTILAGALVAYVTSRAFDVTPLVLFGAGNFIYIGASDLRRGPGAPRLVRSASYREHAHACRVQEGPSPVGYHTVFTPYWRNTRSRVTRWSPSASA
jgi:zinc and cadmium transporter